MREAKFSACCVALLLTAPVRAADDPAFQGGTLIFSGHTWEIKKGEKLGPSGNVFGSGKENIFVDDKGHLHLAINQRDDKKWACAEVRLIRSLGHGEYRWVIAGDLAALDPQGVLGLFLYQDDDREIDYELSRWAGKGDTWNSQFAVMPSEDDAVMLKLGRLYRFDVGKAKVATVSLRWTKGKVEGRFWDGEDAKAKPMVEWEYVWKKGHKEIEVGKERAIIDLWLIKAQPPKDGKRQEIVVRSFQFTP